MGADLGMPSAKTVVVTGANSGIGFQTALHFARAGARVVMACRSLDKAQHAQSLIRKDVQDASTLILPLDVSELESVRQFGELFAEQIGELDILVNNAGMVATPLVRTSAGHELLFATNYLGGFALTGTLLPYFHKARPGRVVNVGSLAHRFGKLNIDDLNWHKTEYDQWKAYANSKVATLSHAIELDRRLRERGRNIIALAAHPGFANTEVNRRREATIRQTAFRKWYVKQMTKIVPSAEMAARSVIRAADAGDVRGGEYYGPRGVFELGGAPGGARINPIAKDAELAASLWQASETLSGIRYLSSQESAVERSRPELLQRGV
jgi:NAD(P)-dependent dehydrogenase (short-subunit alcohol dehydrogenase family)